MAYLALYRQWRPQLFGDIIGQRHITQTLQNALATNQVAHAYLFCGPRGTGKTTAAKVLAKALVCQERTSVEPCNQCINCREIVSGVSMNVIEIDAASHRGIDDIRSLREKIKFAPVAGNKRIYVIDEVHMLTSEAFNALLKTLEEPPPHAVLILATTEPHKVPLTVLSRCQRFDFHRIGFSDLLSRLRDVAAKASFQTEDEALKLIARAAEGGLRDALSMLDQAAAFGNKQITCANVHQILGTVQQEVLEEMASALANQETAVGLKIIDSLFTQGKDLHLFGRDLTAYLRRLLLWHIVPDLENELSPGEKAVIENQARFFNQEQLTQILHILTQAEQNMRWSTQPRVLLELAIVQAALPSVSGGSDIAGRVMPALEERLNALENKIALLTNETGKEIKEKEQKSKRKEEMLPDEAGQPSQLTKTIENIILSGKELTLPRVGELWPEILKAVKNISIPVYTYLSKGQPAQLKENILYLVFPADDLFNQKQMEKTENKKIAEEVLSNIFEQKCRLRCLSATHSLPEKPFLTEGKISLTEACELFKAEEVIFSGGENQEADKMLDW
ncbi:MAG TPA: DNA polymerase III subunit gamma/tau [Desulfotomaculum sp.]|nr:DNA polymerase III subunit gamma/tau [Desulfotomaculum sp.]